VGVDLVASRGGFRLALSEAVRLPFRDAAFDALLCIDVFEHVPDGAGAAREFARVLRPEGVVFLSVPNYSNVAGIVKWFCETFGQYAKHTWAPFRNWQRQELELPMTAGRVRRAFRKAGFRQFRCIGHGPEVGGGLFPWMEHAKMHEAIRFRLQRWFAGVGAPVARVWPGASLHGFWRIDRDSG
jgi:ubiquinone/menaquinone biosynthesis C-methylase UbiE